MPHEQRAPGRRGRLGYIALLLLLVVVSHYGIVVLPVLGPRLIEHFGIETKDLGLLFSGTYLASMAGLALAGPLSDRFGPKAVLVTTFLGAGLSLSLSGAARTLPLYAGGVLLAALFVPALSIAMPAYLARLYPAYTRRVMSVGFMVIAVPSVIFAPLIGRLIHAHPQRLVAFIHVPYALAGALVALGTLLFLRAPAGGDRPEGGDAPGPPRLRRLVRPVIMLILFLGVVHAVSDGTFLMWFPTYARERFGEALKRPGDVIALCGVAYVVSRTILAFLPEARMRRALLVLPGLMGGAILAAAIWMDEPVVMFWGFPLAALCWSWEFPALMGELGRKAPGHLGSLLSLSMVLMQLAGAGAQYAVGTFIMVARQDAPWWMPDQRWAVALSPLGFILFGVLAAATGLGRQEKHA